MVLGPCPSPSDRTPDSGVVVFDDIPAGEKGCTGIPNIRPLSLDGRNKTEGESRRKNRKLWRRAVNALLFQIPLAKKIKNRKSQRKQRRSDSESTPLSKGTLVNDGKQKLGESSRSDADGMVNNPVPSPSLMRSNSTNSSMSSCSSSKTFRSNPRMPSYCTSRTFPSNSSMSSFTNRTFRFTSSKRNEIRHVRSASANSAPSSSCRSTSRSNSSKQGRIRHHGPTIGLYLLAVILVVVVCLGKVCAIVFASTWLIVLPGRIRKMTESPPSAVDSMELCKKRVIIEKPLSERNRSSKSVLYWK